MAPTKNKRKKKGAVPRKSGRPRLLFWVVVGLFVAVSGWFTWLILDPEDESVPPGYYEEARPAADPASSGRAGEKSPVLPDNGDLGAGAALPLIAIVIDDMGYNKKTCEALLDLDLNLSFAFLPFGPYTAKQAHQARRLGRDILLHFPMEATDAKWKAGRGTITIAMDAPEIREIFHENLAAVPYAVGINNHMGSRFTQNSRVMKIFLNSVPATGLFFLDSRTSQNSVGYGLAREMGLKTAQRDIFLDNDRDPRKIIVQLRKLLVVAREHGSAIAIGHPYPETLQALTEYQRVLGRRAKVVGVAALVR